MMNNALELLKPARVFLLFSSIIMFLAPAAFAQEESSADIEEIIVEGIKGSAKSQREAKRNAKNITDSIFAEEFGTMPDSNVAEALQRVTGIGIDRRDGEGTFVTVRGVDPNLNQVTLNGQTATTGQDGSDFDFSMLSADMLKAIEVVKTPSANHIEGSLGGTVNLLTNRPLDMRYSIRSLEVQMQKSVLADETDPVIKANFADKFDNDRIGISASLFSDTKNTRTDMFQSFDLFQVRNVPGISYQTGEDLGDVWANIPNFLEQVINFDERTRTGGNLMFQFRPNEASEYWIDHSFTRHEIDKDRFAIRVNRLHRNSATNQNPSLPVAGTWIIDETRDIALAGQAGKSAGNQISMHWVTPTDTSITELGTIQDIGEFTVTAKLGLSRSEQTWPDYKSLNFLAFGNTTHQNGFDYRNPDGGFFLIPTFILDEDRNPSAPVGLTFNQTWIYDRLVTDDQDTYSIDIERDVDVSIFDKIQFGGRYFDREKGRSQTRAFANPVTPDGAVRLTTEGISQPFPVDDFFADVAPNALTSGWVIPDVNLVFDQYVNPDFVANYEADPLNSWYISMDATAFYFMADFTLLDDRLTGDVGVRYVDTNQRGVGTGGINFPRNEGSAQFPVDVSHSYSNVLPSLNMTYMLREDMLLRFAASKVIARPSFNDLRAGTTVRASNRNETPRASGGNPAADPYEATNYDLSYEWYFGESGLFSAAIFYKDITAFNFNQTQLSDAYPDNTNSSSGILLDSSTCLNPYVAPVLETGTGRLNADGVLIPVSMYDAETCEAAQVTISLPRSGEGGFIKGYELGYQQAFTKLPGLLSGLGVMANYTFTDSEASYFSEGNEAYSGFSFLNTSKDTINATVYWQKDRHSAKLAYNYRSPRMVNASTLTNSVYMEGRKSVDFSANYQINKMFRLSFHALNLTEEYDRKFLARTVESNGLAGEGNAIDNDIPDYLTTDLRYTGRTYRLGLYMNFN